ncbi:unnamed protein product [Schistosoma margrebowiei]|uniref:Uncharacterized protein n=1 Tax=Schistosoma margrebowiei TaxID=48269 RepID=A0A183NCP4_9TREM|nr:unnamed protein product [Schistosoma margrebowiei]
MMVNDKWNRVIHFDKKKQPKEYITIQCTWCKIGYHNKSTCFHESYFTEPCSLGPYSSLIVPPDWIIKLTDRVSFYFRYIYRFISYMLEIILSIGYNKTPSKSST